MVARRYPRSRSASLANQPHLRLEFPAQAIRPSQGGEIALTGDDLALTTAR